MSDVFDLLRTPTIPELCQKIDEGLREAGSPEGAFHKKSFTDKEGAVAAPFLLQKVDKLPESDQKTEMTSMLIKLASGGWSEEETKHFHELFKTAKHNQKHHDAGGTSGSV